MKDCYFTDFEIMMLEFIEHGNVMQLGDKESCEVFDKINRGIPPEFNHRHINNMAHAERTLKEIVFNS